MSENALRHNEPLENMPAMIHLKDYKKHAFYIDTINLDVHLDMHKTIVTAVSTVGRNRGYEDLYLDGHSMDLISVYVNDVPLLISDYIICDKGLTIKKDILPDTDFKLKIITQINPADNTTLEGLYRSGTMYCTQCESQGFRKITYYIDRPDNMAVFTVRVVGENDKMPILLSNGTKTTSGVTKDGKPYAVWHDPHKKPSYLFALVAGDLECYRDNFVTMSGRDVVLEIYTEYGNLDKCVYAMDSLKRSMKWDEEKYGREYDLDIFMIVAVGDFNFGAMENKGLNIFNSKYILAQSDTATDTDYEHIEGVVAHEYFHNWTGNRITCRDWFQLCLKEGLTVFRDQSFSGDMRNKITKRIDDVIALRSAQFSEDSGGLAHPVRPEHYIEINNFYTATVYEKGAELCRMLYIMLGADDFRKGTDLYFERYDGMAVTVEDFISAMADASYRDLSQFLLWYKQSGTPHITADGFYNESKKQYLLTVSQKTNPDANQSQKLPLHIPVVTALLSPSGQPINSLHNGKTAHEHILELKYDKTVFVFDNVNEPPVPSVLRGFSAPVILHQNLSQDDMVTLMTHDTDLFNRYETAQKFIQNIILSLYNNNDFASEQSKIDVFIRSVQNCLNNDSYDGLFKSYYISLPSVGYLMQQMNQVVPEKLYQARLNVREYIAKSLEADFLTVYHNSLTDTPFDASPISAARRSLGNSALSYLLCANNAHHALAEKHYKNADNMTDMMGALSALSDKGGDIYQSLMQDFYTRFESDALVIDKWFALQARSQNADCLNDVKKLLTHKDFTYKNPNRVRSLIGVFAHGNLVHFHNSDSYAFIAQQILILDKLNPKTASRLATSFDQIHTLDTALVQNARDVLNGILSDKSTISNDVLEIITKILG